VDPQAVIHDAVSVRSHLARTHRMENCDAGFAGKRQQLLITADTVAWHVFLRDEFAQRRRAAATAATAPHLRTGSLPSPLWQCAGNGLWTSKRRLPGCLRTVCRLRVHRFRSPGCFAPAPVRGRRRQCCCAAPAATRFGAALVPLHPDEVRQYVRPSPARLVAGCPGNARLDRGMAPLGGRGRFCRSCAGPVRRAQARSGALKASRFNQLPKPQWICGQRTAVAGARGT